MPRIEPSEGRIVWFYKAAGTEEHTNVVTYTGAPCAALVALVLPKDSKGRDVLNLDVVDHEGRHHPMHNVILAQDGEPDPEGETCFARWMPYQIGQAAKTDEAEKRNERFRNEVRGEQDDPRADGKVAGDNVVSIDKGPAGAVSG